MKIEVITNEDLERAKKKAQRREEFEEKKARLKYWLYCNKEAIVILAPAVLGLTAKSITAISRSINTKKEQDLQDLYCYDRSLGHYWRLRRKLSNKEWVEIDKRKAQGERLADILSELKVLK